MGDFGQDAREAWNAGAEGYMQFVESGADYYRHLVHGPGLLAACGEVRGARALDLGCGQGYFSRLLARAGAAVTAIDLSDRLIARAIELEAAEPLGITYRVMDAARVGTDLGPERFDRITACMSLQDVSDVAATLAGASRVLADGGRMVFSVPHPCTDPPLREWKRDDQGRKLALCLDRYFDTGPATCHWNMARLTYHWRTPFHRYTLTQWSGLIREAGFLIHGLSEPRPDRQLLAAHPELDDCARMPYFLVFDLVRGGG
jgi:2-polyprenyl-3-methyl-5-hydroxy-6-metoxy-1,4-benzoquinol methylase